MIDLDQLIQNAFDTVEQVIPQAIVHGRLVKYTSVYNRDTATYVNTESDSQDVRCVFDHTDELYRTSENTNTVVTKIHVFGYLEKPVDMFNELQLTMDTGIVKYKTGELRKINVGESSVLHTFIVTS